MERVAGPAPLRGAKFLSPLLNMPWLRRTTPGQMGFLLLLLAMTGYPIMLLLLNSFQVNEPGQELRFGLSGWVSAYSDPRIQKGLWNTIYIAGIRTVLATTIAVFFAWVVARTDTPGRAFVTVALWIGFFLPSLSMVLGWIMLLDPSTGVINVWLYELTGYKKTFDIYSYGGIIWAHLAASTSIRFMLLLPAFMYMNSALEEAAMMSGRNKLNVLRTITVPLLLPSIIAVTVLGFINSLESFEIELILGLPAGIMVFSTLVYELAIQEPPLYGQATAMGVVFLGFIMLVIWFQRWAIGRRRYEVVTGRMSGSTRIRLGRWRYLTLGIMVLHICVFIVLPATALLSGTFMRLFGYMNVENPWTTANWIGVLTDPLLLGSFKNTMMLVAGALAIGPLLYFFTAYVSRGNDSASHTIRFLTWLPWVMPGILLGLAMLWVFLGTGGIFIPIYGTLIPMIIAVVIYEFPVGLQIIGAFFKNTSRELEEAAYVSGAGKMRMLRQILLPIARPSLVSVGLVVTVFAMRDLSVIILLTTAPTRPISLLMLEYIGSSSLEQASVVGILISLMVVSIAMTAKVLRLDIVRR